MPTCYDCGEEIEFRYIDGKSTPIHLSGYFCSGYSGRRSPDNGKPFGTIASYVNPNAYCPVCGEQVYFYQSPFGGRVFFDDLGWPWPKHQCTDSARAQTASVKRITLGSRSTFRSRSGKFLQLFRLAELEEEHDRVCVRFREIGKLVSISSFISKSDMRNNGITIKDLKMAPSFVVETHDNERVIGFVCARLGKVVQLTFPRIRS